MIRRTVTFTDTGQNREVTGLLQLGLEKTLRLEEFRSGMVLFGSGKSCHVQLEEEFVSHQQFALTRKGPEWLINGVPSAKNPTYLNNVIVTTSDVALCAGAVIRVGSLAWVTIGPAYQLGEWYIAARNLDEFYTSALTVYGSARKAAEALGVDQRTYLRHIHQIPRAEAILRQQIADREQGQRRSYRPPFGVPVAALAFTNLDYHSGVADGVPTLIDTDIPYTSQLLCS
jgi:hypothetical protein